MCFCVYRKVFRITLQRYLDYADLPLPPYTNGKSYSMPVVEWRVDFEHLVKRTLLDEDHKIFAAMVRGEEYSVTCARLHIKRGYYFNRKYSIEARCGKALYSSELWSRYFV